MNTTTRLAAACCALLASFTSVADPVPTKPIDVELIVVDGTVLKNQGERYEAAVVRDHLKKLDRVMTMDDSRAVVHYFEGCEFEIEEGNEVEIPEQLPCECLDFSEAEEIDEPVARIIEAEGPMQLGRDDVFSAVTLNQQLRVGEVLRVPDDSRALIEFREGCQVEMDRLDNDGDDKEDYEIPDRSPCPCAAWLVNNVSPTPLDVKLARIYIPLVLLVPLLNDDRFPVSP
jgi:hypothetical protein